MRLFITGADGMLGSNLVRLLLEREHEVGVLIHPSSRSVSLDDLKITRHFGDILKPESLVSAVEGYDAVIHAAASTSIWPSRSEIVRKINIYGPAT
jgi:dihydroflavonol-4-reductase